MGRRLLHFLGATILFLAISLLVLPNACNRREQYTFSGEERVSGSTIISENGDSISAYITRFYSRGGIVRTLLGSHFREMWSTPVTMPVFSGTFDSLHFNIVKMGGGQQTTSLKLKDQYGRSFTLRSVDKDQSRALPNFLRKTGIRTLFRDQASALNPYAAPVAIALAKTAKIPSTDARLFIIPSNNQFPDSLQHIVLNRVMLLETEPDESWENLEYYGYPAEITDTGEMLERLDHDLRADFLSYGYCRLFDVLIGDWDRHGDQWMWAVDSLMVAHPIPMDRDMALYNFSDGLINKLALYINPKFQTFEPGFSNLDGYMINGMEMDTTILPRINRSQWDSLANELKSRLTESAVLHGFRQYPEELYESYGNQHQEVLLRRLQEIDSAAAYLHYRFTSRQ